MPVAPESVMLGYVTDGWNRNEFTLSLLQLTSAPAYELVGEVTSCDAGALVPDGRNALTAQFLDGPLEWLWFLDDDVAFTPGTLTRLAEAADPDGCPVITGLCPVARGEGGPAIYHTAPAGGGDTEFIPMSGWPDDAVIRVGACGAACLFIHRSALETIRAAEGGQNAWFRQSHTPRVSYGEDLSFSLRLAGAGIPLHAHTGAQVAHMKVVRLGKALP